MIPEPDETRPNGIQVIARAAALLRVLRDSPSGMSLGQIAAKTGLPRSTVQRIVDALLAERFLIAPPRGGGIRLGPELYALAGAAQASVVDRYRPHLDDLVRSTGETVDLSVLRGERMIFLDQVQGTQRLRTNSAVGEVFPLTTTANGRACLALLPDDLAERLAASEWARDGTRGDMPALRSMLRGVRQTGLAFDLEDHSPGVKAIGFAIADAVGDLHAISMPIPSTRYDAVSDKVVAALRALRARLAGEKSP